MIFFPLSAFENQKLGDYPGTAVVACVCQLG